MIGVLHVDDPSIIAGIAPVDIEAAEGQLRVHGCYLLYWLRCTIGLALLIGI